jgi:ATP-dependent RNA helicase A
VIASKSCALSLVRQLFHYGVIEAYTGERKKKEAPKVSEIEQNIALVLCLGKGDLFLKL